MTPQCPTQNVLQAPVSIPVTPWGSHAPAAPGNQTPGCSHPSGSQSHTQIRAQAFPLSPGLPAHPASPAGHPRAGEAILGSLRRQFLFHSGSRDKNLPHPYLCACGVGAGHVTFQGLVWALANQHVQLRLQLPQGKR